MRRGGKGSGKEETLKGRETKEYNGAQSGNKTWRKVGRGEETKRRLC